MAGEPSTLIPHLVADGAAEAIEFYKRAFGAVEVARIMSPDGSKIVHAAIRIRDNTLYLMDAFGTKDAKTLGGSPITLHLQVPDVDALFAQVIAAGAREIMAVEDMFWGDRYGQLEDPFGHRWSIATKVYEPSHEEIAAALRRYLG